MSTCHHFCEGCKCNIMHSGCHFTPPLPLSPVYLCWSPSTRHLHCRWTGGAGGGASSVGSDPHLKLPLQPSQTLLSHVFVRMLSPARLPLWLLWEHWMWCLQGVRGVWFYCTGPIHRQGYSKRWPPTFHCCQSSELAEVRRGGTHIGPEWASYDNIGPSSRCCLLHFAPQWCGHVPDLSWGSWRWNAALTLWLHWNAG